MAGSRVAVDSTTPGRAQKVLLATVAAGFALVVGSSPALAESPDAGGGRPGRYVSTQAYQHALRAEFALARADRRIAHDELLLALVYDPSSVHLHTKLVRLMLSQGSLTAARKYAERARTLAGGRVEILRLVAEVLTASQQLEPAERMLRRAARRAPRDLDVALALADVLALRGRRSVALKHLRRLARRHRRSQRPLLATSELLRAQGKWADAARALERAEARGALSATAAGALADCYERTLRLAAAASTWAELAQRKPDDAHAALEAARLALALERDAEAERWLAEAVRRDPTAPVGRALLAEGVDDRAAVALSDAAKRSTVDSATRFSLGLALARSGRDDEALGHLGRVPIGTSDYVQARLLMSKILMRQGRHQRAELALEVALQTEPGSPELLDRYAELLVRRDRPEVALTAVRRGRAIAPVEPRLWSAELRLLDVLGRKQQARTLLKTARQTLPIAVRLRLQAERHIRSGRTQAARRVVRRWVRAAPRDFDALVTAAEVGVSVRRRWARRALGERPQDPRALGALGIALLRDGRQRAALEHLRRAARLDPWNAAFAEAHGDAAVAIGRLDEAALAYGRARRAIQGDRRALRTDWRRSERRVQRKEGALRRRG